jgi:hypothetical protein
MRAKTEYDKWCALERQHENRFSHEQQKAYITGFNRAIELVELFLKEKQNETSASIS